MARKRDKKRNLKPYLLGAGGLAGAVGLGALGARTKGGKEVVQRIRGFIRGGKPVTGHSRTVTQAASATPGRIRQTTQGWKIQCANSNRG
jgi:invasion protein IalB